MPLYEYACDSCGARFERIQKFSDPPVSTCPTCGAGVRKLISSPAIQFKGDGWYVTDYARPKASEAKASEGASSKDGGDDKAAPAAATADKGADSKASDKGTSSPSGSTSSPASSTTSAKPPGS